MTGLNHESLEQATRDRQAELRTAQSLITGFHFFVYTSAPNEWRWIRIPTAPDAWSSPFGTKEEARVAGEAAGGIFERYEE